MNSCKHVCLSIHSQMNSCRHMSVYDVFALVDCDRYTCSWCLITFTCTERENGTTTLTASPGSRQLGIPYYRPGMLHHHHMLVELSVKKKYFYCYITKCMLV